jgi:hypothetical protein
MPVKVRKPSPAAGASSSGGDSRKSPLNHPGGVSSGKTRLSKPPTPTKGMMTSRKSPSTLIPIMPTGTHTSKTKPKTNSVSGSPVVASSHMTFQSLLLSESERYPQQHGTDDADDYGHDLALQALVSQQIQDDIAENQRSGSAQSTNMGMDSSSPMVIHAPSSNVFGGHGTGTIPSAPLCGVGFVGGIGFDVDDDDLDVDDGGSEGDENELDRQTDDEVIYDDDESSECGSNDDDSNDELEVNNPQFTYVSAPSSYGNRYCAHVNPNNYFFSSGTDSAALEGSSTGPNSRNSSSHGMNTLLSVVSPSAASAPASDIIAVLPTSPASASSPPSVPVEAPFGTDDDERSVDPSELPEKYLYHMIATCQAEIVRRHGPTATAAAVGSGSTPNTEFVSAGTSTASGNGEMDSPAGGVQSTREPRRPGSANGHHGHGARAIRKKSGSFSSLNVNTNAGCNQGVAPSSTGILADKRFFANTTMYHGSGHHHMPGTVSTRRPQSGNATHRNKRAVHKNHSSGSGSNSYSSRSRSYHNEVHDPELQSYDERYLGQPPAAESGRQMQSRAEIPVEKMFATIVHTYHRNEANADTTEHDVMMKGIGMFSKTSLRHVPPLRLDSVPPPPPQPETGIRSPRSAFDDLSVCSQGSVTSNSGSTTSLSSRGSVFKPPAKSNVQKQVTQQTPSRRKTVK